MERHFPIKTGQPITAFSPFPNGTANFGRNIPTEIPVSGPPPEVIPNIPVRRSRNGPSFLFLNSDQNFRNLWHNGKHPGFREGFARFPAVRAIEFLF